MEFEKKKKFPKAKMEDEDDMKKAKYNSKLVFPKGDLGVADDKEMARMFPRKIKNAGKELVSSKELPYRGAGPMEKDRGM